MFLKYSLAGAVGRADRRLDRADLRVVGRTSAFQFKGQNRDLRAIGQALSATHLIEGSVRKDGDRLRVTAQLIKADDGTHVWAENYDRQLTDVFAIQEDVARAIAGALRMPLGLAPGQSLVAVRPKDEQTYELFLRGRAAFRARRPEDALRFLDEAVARDPNFAPGWRFLAAARNTVNIERRIRRQEPITYPESEETLARRVIALAPDSADGYAMLAGLANNDGQGLEAIQLQEQALARDPNDTEIMNAYASGLWELGYLKEAVEVRDRQHLLEPLVLIYNFLRAETLAANGMVEQALRDWLAVAPKNSAGQPAGRRLILPAYAQRGRFDQAITRLSGADVVGGNAGVGVEGAVDRAQADAAVRVLRAVANKTAPPTQLPAFDGEMLWVYAYTSMPERMLDFFERPRATKRYVWWPMPSSLRKTERFKTFMRNAGFVDIWRMRGWPDRCRPVGTDDFVCE
jgi:tetratricopeptide (TPR) repeat protein